MKKPKIAICNISNFQNFPIGGTMLLLKQMLPELKKYFNISLIGFDYKKSKKIGWQKLKIPEGNFDFISIPYPKYLLKISEKINKNNYKNQYAEPLEALVKKYDNILRIIYHNGLYQIKNELEQKDFDLFYIHVPAAVQSIYDMFPNKKILFHLHGPCYPLSMISAQEQKTIYKNYQKLYDNAFELSKKTLFVGDKETCSDFAKKYPNEKNKFIATSNLVNQKTFYPRNKLKMREKWNLPKNKFLINFVGRLHKVKGLNLLIKSLPNVLKKIDAEIIFIGDGEEKQNLSDLSQKLGVEKKVKFLGFKNSQEIAEINSACDLFVLPSYTEGFSVALLEAMSCGEPVISTNVCGAIDQIDNGKNGFVLKKRDPKKLAEYILKVSKNQKEFSKNAIKKSKKFSSVFVTKRIAKMINNVISA